MTNKIRHNIGAKTVTSPKAKYEPAGVATGHSEEVQRLVAHLHDKQKMDPETIAQVSGLTVEAVLTLTEVANCNTCLWFKSLGWRF